MKRKATLKRKAPWQQAPRLLGTDVAREMRNLRLAIDCAASLVTVLMMQARRAYTDGVYYLERGTTCRGQLLDIRQCLDQMQDVADVVLPVVREYADDPDALRLLDALTTAIGRVTGWLADLDKRAGEA